MEMTNEERQDYEKLTRKEKEYFDFYSKTNPDWSFKQIMVKLAFDEKTKIVIEKGGSDANLQNPSIWKTILEGVIITLSRFNSIGSSVINAIGDAIAELKGLIKAGVDKIGDAINSLWGKIF